jgi:hypothetical protein
MASKHTLHDYATSSLTSITGTTEPIPRVEAGGEESESSPEPDILHHQDYRSVSPPIQQPTNVVQAIHAAVPDRLYTLLLEIVTTIPAAQALAEERLLVPMTSTAASSVQPNLKRKAYEVCANCNQEYSVESNSKGDCVYHEGKYRQGPPSIIEGLADFKT